MKYKKLVIILSSVLGAIALCLILSFTLFRVSVVEINFKNGTTLYASQEDKQAIINSGKFSYSTPVFSVNKSKIIERLEKENYYLKVINIETVFPNKLIVHCAEREELFALKLGESLYYICDQHLKVLRLDTSYKSEQGNALLLDGIDIFDKSVKVGENLNLTNCENLVKDISDAFAYNNKTISDIKGMFKTISISYEKNYYTKNTEPVFTFTTFDNFKTKITLPNSFFVEKINLMLALVPKSTAYFKTHSLIIEINPTNVSDTYIRYEKLEK